ncbi:MAG TPA: DUF5392 family protein [Chondromyces sp.]|nr:DUF5392 family protein [Chondromyces sp.]
MNFFMMNKMPGFIQKEIEQMQNILSPLIKRASKYMWWSIPLISISFFNLFLLLFVSPPTEHRMVTIFIYALIGAIGMALRKEMKNHTKKMEQVSADYMVERIKKSDKVSAYRKKEYVHSIKEQPKKAIHYFINFLNEEENKRKESL